jgi:potassium channel subfamily K, other eukaryote
MYCVASFLVVVNIRGYVQGHYPQHFEWTDTQRLTIIGAIMFSVWLVCWAALFSHVGSLGFADALYFCNINIITVGYGGISPPNNTSRAIVIPLVIGGILFYGMTVNAVISVWREIVDLKLSWQMSKERRKRSLLQPQLDAKATLSASPGARLPPQTLSEEQRPAPVSRFTWPRKKPLLLREEEDRFNAMREIQTSNQKYKQRWLLMQNVAFFFTYWLLSAVVFWKMETHFTYFEALYFCFVTLLTIGSSELYPISNGGKSFLVLWSIIGVPATTLLVSDLSEALLSFTGSSTDLARQIKRWIRRSRGKASVTSEERLKKEIEQGFAISDPDQQIDDWQKFKLEGFSNLSNEQDLALLLSIALDRVKNDMKHPSEIKYSFDQWQDFAILMRFTTVPGYAIDDQETNFPLHWDWIGPDSPLISHQSEPEYVADGLCESLKRYVRRQRDLQKQRGETVKNTMRTMLGTEKAGRQRRYSVSSF